MKKVPLWMCLLLLLLASAAGEAGAATVRPMTLEELVRESQCVVYGRSVGSRSFWDSVTSTIWTETEFLVLDAPKGEVGRTVRITEPGGILGNTGHLIPGVPQFAADREAVVFLYAAPGNRLRVLGLGQGVYNVFREPATGDLLARPSLETREVVYEEGRSLARAPGEILNTRKLGEFLFLIRRRASIR